MVKKKKTLSEDQKDVLADLFNSDGFADVKKKLGSDILFRASEEPRSSSFLRMYFRGIGRRTAAFQSDVPRRCTDLSLAPRHPWGCVGSQACKICVLPAGSLIPIPLQVRLVVVVESTENRPQCSSTRSRAGTLAGLPRSV